jgi:hypothetical protein
MKPNDEKIGNNLWESEPGFEGWMKGEDWSCNLNESAERLKTKNESLKFEGWTKLERLKTTCDWIGNAIEDSPEYDISRTHCWSKPPRTTLKLPRMACRYLLVSGGGWKRRKNRRYIQERRRFTLYRLRVSVAVFLFCCSVWRSGSRMSCMWWKMINN